ncbi:16S rRNA (uracil(1498)-N(3))-methyltransferase [Deinococcus peraridilitoris]|uniref:Ribosomal RNA small subunit methyltransferase E n=1 Tax=Deinococcus peraridilitoris (strain DSM 19664 / LMG 22246 / CIP 109416 / KR-200) TaxID=937777 RepID=L0A747_DEIPD|nr:16S rRNA (uracil(1498)-N(3))-methyltransferase [Deinococcus peraridilitoris]AFZ68880.1 RNA methyltransferase, RsmE family [Deinococcus peraridilitoris DSM 19664]
MHRVRVDFLQESITLTAREARHLRVLRLTPGDIVRVFDGHGQEAQASLVRLDDELAELRLGALVDAAPETPQPVTLAVALLKGDKLTDVVRASTELGVSRIQLLSTRFADVPEIGNAKLQRLDRVAQEAAKQSRRAVVPVVLRPIPLSALPETTQGFVAHPGSTSRLTALLDWSVGPTLVSGPEGGFSEQEIALLRSRGYHAVTLGQRILRAETAPLALLGAIAATGV